MSLLKSMRQKRKAELIAARVNPSGYGLECIRKGYKTNLVASRIRRLGYGLGWLTVLILWIIGCGATYPSGGPQSRFWSQVRPADIDTERLVRNARYFKAAGRPQLALKELEEAHHREPNNLKIVNVLTQCYEDLGDWQRAEELYLEALEESNNPALANNLCFSYYLAGRYEKAAEGFRKLLKEHPHSTTVRNNLGLVLTRMGKQEEALALWEKAEGKDAAAQRLCQALTALGLMQSGSQEKQVAGNVGPGTSSEAIQMAADKTAYALPSEGHPGLPNASAALHPAGDHNRESGEAAQARLNSTGTENFEQKYHQPSKLPVLRAWEIFFTKIQILNGNGVNDMARQNRSRLYLEGFDAVRIGNHENFAQDQTTIYYRPHAARVAKVLGAKFYHTDNLKVDPELSGDLEVRVVLGRDVLQKKEVLAKLAD
ncbi:MAG: LytR C-terminal domain-containing protein [Deltaproteobacteria bacterium]|nr:LytR C-terminal domain-containing protein [Desulfitobacteriaceae bacterium]MDI6854822.1 LytR C-terminal domain-containing protein [Deltaproteobacteria bacterium]